jgi:hypothetical protein
MLEGNVAVSTAFIITMGSAMITYFWGRYFLQQSVEKTADDLISVLEKDGYVKCNTDENGEKILVKIDDILLVKIRNETH